MNIFTLIEHLLQKKKSEKIKLKENFYIAKDFILFI